MNYKNANDNEILYLIAENNDEYANIIYRKYRPIIIAMAKRYSSAICDNCMDYDDLVQAGLMGLYYAIRCYKGEKCLFYTYACICIRKSIERTVYRKNKKRMSLNLVTYDENLVYMEDIYHDNYIFVLIKNILSSFDSLVFELRINGFSYIEIATLLDVNIRKVDYTLQKIRKKVKTLLLNESFVL